jgi:hypothetical protein
MASLPCTPSAYSPTTPPLSGAEGSRRKGCVSEPKSRWKATVRRSSRPKVACETRHVGVPDGFHSGAGVPKAPPSREPPDSSPRARRQLGGGTKPWSSAAMAFDGSSTSPRPLQSAVAPHSRKSSSGDFEGSKLARKLGSPPARSLVVSALRPQPTSSRRNSATNPPRKPSVLMSTPTSSIPRQRRGILKGASKRRHAARWHRA